MGEWAGRGKGLGEVGEGEVVVGKWEVEWG